MLLRAVKSTFRSLARTKTLNHGELVTTELSRCLGIADLTAIGVGGTLGAGIYVLAGQVAREEAGPAIVLSFLIAAIVSMLSGLCYAEFGARVPKAGSAYIYSYVTVGEFLAFVIGWSMIMDNIIAAATVGKAWSQYLDSIVNQTISTAIKSRVQFDSPWFGDYPDILAFALLIVLTIIVALGAKMSTVVMMALTGVNLLVIAFVIVAGSFYVEGENWTSGGFFPYGASGVFAGAATCFYAYVGFDAIATSGEEAKNPSRAIPIAIALTLFICMLCYMSVSAVLTLMLPYDQLSPYAPLAEVFQSRGLPAGRYIVATGSLLGLSSAMLGSIFPLPRIIYAMAKDGLLFKFLARVNSKTDVPVTAAVMAGVLTAIMALIFNLEQLVEMMSIGTLLSYSLVAASVLLLRYHPKEVGLSKDEVKQLALQSAGIKDETEESMSLVEKSAGKYMKYTDAATPGDAVEDTVGSKPDEPSSRAGYGLLQNEGTDQQTGSKKTPPTLKTYMVVSISFAIFVVLIVSLCCLLAFGMDEISRIEWWAIALLCLFVAAIVCLTVIIETQPQNQMELYFKAPAVPFLPLLALLCNTYLMMKLSPATWARLVIWLAVGLVIYFSYGIRHSVETQRRRDEAPSTTMSEDTAGDGAFVEESQDVVEKTKDQ